MCIAYNIPPLFRIYNTNFCVRLVLGRGELSHVPNPGRLFQVHEYSRARAEVYSTVLKYLHVFTLNAFSNTDKGNSILYKIRNICIRFNLSKSIDGITTIHQVLLSIYHYPFSRIEKTKSPPLCQYWCMPPSTTCHYGVPYSATRHHRMLHSSTHRMLHFSSCCCHVLYSTVHHHNMLHSGAHHHCMLPLTSYPSYIFTRPLPATNMPPTLPLATRSQQ